MSVVARRLWVEAGGSGEALHHGTVRERDREWESEKESNERENEKKNDFFLIVVFLIFFNYKN